MGQAVEGLHSLVREEGRHSLVQEGDRTAAAGCRRRRLLQAVTATAEVLGCSRSREPKARHTETGRAVQETWTCNCWTGYRRHRPWQTDRASGSATRVTRPPCRGPAGLGRRRSRRANGRRGQTETCCYRAGRDSCRS
jgi:hypothetical protein